MLQPHTDTPNDEAGPRSAVVADLRRRISTGQLLPGDALPSERMLATNLGVARDTVRAALTELIERGWIEAGKGCRRRVSRGRRDAALSTCIGILSAADSQVFDADKPWVEDRYVMALAAATLEQEGHHIVTVSMPALLRSQNDRIMQGDLRAFVVAANMCDQPVVGRIMASMDQAGAPVILYGRTDDQNQRPAVYSDHFAGGRSLVAWLLARGRRRIACAWMRTSSRTWMDDRYAGYAAAMREAGLEAMPLIDIPKIPEGDGTQQAFDHQSRVAAGYLAEHLRAGSGIDALLALNDPQAISLAAACRRLGCQPNADVWLAGYDNSWRYAKEWSFEGTGPMVTVDKDNAGMARRLAELVLAKTAGGAVGQAERIICTPLVLPVEAASTSRDHHPALSGSKV
jgi:DNA-binding LacI/PurR family transcriptional regulator